MFVRNIGKNVSWTVRVMIGILIQLRVQPLLCNRRIHNGVMQPVSRQQICKHVPAVTNMHTIERGTQLGDQLVVNCQSRAEFCMGGSEDGI
jgi:hypothetical protein